MSRWDALLVAGCVLLVLAAGAVDWRLGAAVAGFELLAVWYWLADDGEEN